MYMKTKIMTLYMCMYMYLCIYNPQKDDTEDVNDRKKEYKAESDLSAAIFNRFFPQVRVYSSLAGLKLNMYLRLVLNSWFFCLHLQSAGIPGMWHHLKADLFMVLRVYVCACGCVWHIKSKEGIRSPGTGVAGSGEPPFECWELSPGPLQE